MKTTTNKKYIIVKDRVEIYKDFTLNLLYYIDYYYIDYDSIHEDSDINNHYSWCFNKVCNEFKKEEIDFSANNELKEYFRTYYYHQFYKIKGTNRDISLAYYEKFWKEIFNIEKQKNRNILNILIEIYTIYDKSINNEKNILEIV
jgi:hypothetical protein